jgi:superfamily II DNA or RNA helicase
MTIKGLIKKYPYLRVLVVVPTTTLKNQWLQHVNEWGFDFNVEIIVINSIIKQKYICDYLILDEIHRFNSDLFKEVFNCVKYKLILGLTATFERLDGKEKIAARYCPVVEEITKMECLANGWISDYKEYQVLLEVDNISEYKEMNKEFIRYFEFFNYDFNKATKCCGKDGWKYKLQLRDEMYKGNDESKKKEMLQLITINSMGLMRTVQRRKAFINNHPKKIEIAKRIMEARKDAKIITFSNNVKMAEAIQNGENVYTGKLSKKRSETMIDDFLTGKITQLNSCAKLDAGFDDPEVSVAIILGTDSSEIKAIQRRGRAVRAAENKNAEIFYLVIKDTVEEKWVKNNHKKDTDLITIDEHGLNQVLKGEQPELYKKKLGEFLFRW